MNVRQKLSLAALSLILPVMASAQAPAAEAPAFAIKPYGFLGLTAVSQDATFKYPEYASQITSESGHTFVLSARQSRFGLNFSGADGGITGAALNARLEFDFMNGGGSVDGVGLRLRYAYALADWKLGPGKLSLLAGQTDGLVNPLHPEVAAHLALPTFMQSGNLTRRSPQIRVGYAMPAGPVTVSLEAAALNASDDGTGTPATDIISYGNDNGSPDFEARLQGVATLPANVKITLGVGYHYNDQYRPTGNLAAKLVGVDVNADITKWVNVRGEWFSGEGIDKTYTGAFAAAKANGDAVGTTGFWVQATGKPLPYLWIMAGLGSTTANNTAATGNDDPAYAMVNVGVISNVSKNWRLGLEYTSSAFDSGVAGADTLTGSEWALSSRFSF